MKNLLTTLAIILFCSITALNAQWLPTTGTSSVIYNNPLTSYVGIGTATPGACFDNGNLNSNLLKAVLARLSEGNTTGVGTYLGVTALNTQPASCNSFAIQHSFYGQINSSINFYRGGSTIGGFLTFNTDNNTEVMRITASGNVGIGTNTPNQKLEISGKIRLNTAASKIEWNSNTLQLGSYVDNISVVQILGSASYNPRLDIMRAGNASQAIVLNASGNSYLNGGNVLIGKTSQVNSNYILDVNGNVRANEVVVNTDGSDFVFENSYKLRSLNELETFVKENKHLPEIAPAKDMQENGVSVSEMQNKLLQKVEELTLYVIEQNKRIEALEKETEKH